MADIAERAQRAIRYTKDGLNNWLRPAGPTFGKSSALDFLDFTATDASAG